MVKGLHVRWVKLYGVGVLHSGIFMLPSRFGYIIPGRRPEVKSDKQERRSFRMLVTTNLNQIASDEAFYCSVNVSLA